MNVRDAPVNPCDGSRCGRLRLYVTSVQHPNTTPKETPCRLKGQPGIHPHRRGRDPQPKYPRKLKIGIAVGVLAVLGAGAAVASTAATLDRNRQHRRRHQPRRGAEAGLLRQHHARRRFGGREAGLHRGEPGRHQALHAGVQRRARGDRGAERRRDRCDLHRPEPGDQLVRQEQGRVGQHHRRRGLRRGAAGGQARDQNRRGPEGQDPGFSAARRHPGRGAARLAGQAGLQDQHRRRRGRRDQPHRERPDAEAVPGRKARRRVAAGAVGSGWCSRPARRSWWTRRTSGTGR